MTRKSITTRFVKKLKSLFVTQVSEGVLCEIEGIPLAKKYVNCLLLYMYTKRILDLELYKDASLPAVLEEFEEGVSENVTYAEVEERLREMAASEDREGKKQINLHLSANKWICSVDFEADKCRLRLREQEWTDVEG